MQPLDRPGAGSSHLARILTALPRAAQVDFAPLQRSDRCRRRRSGAACRWNAAPTSSRTPTRCAPVPSQLASRLAGEGFDEAGLSQCTEALAEAELFVKVGGRLSARKLAPAACHSRWMSCWRPESITPIFAADQPPARLGNYLGHLRERAAHRYEARRACAAARPERASSAICWYWRRSGSNICGNARQARKPRGPQDMLLAWTTARRADRLN